ncbi:hypothetical protein Trydic_g19965 [Trypoxylus dichotomus]
MFHDKRNFAVLVFNEWPRHSNRRGHLPNRTRSKEDTERQIAPGVLRPLREQQRTTFTHSARSRRLRFLKRKALHGYRWSHDCSVTLTRPCEKKMRYALYKLASLLALLHCLLSHALVQANSLKSC